MPLMVKTPPTIAHALVKNCMNDDRLSVNLTCSTYVRVLISNMAHVMHMGIGYTLSHTPYTLDFKMYSPALWYTAVETKLLVDS